MAITVAELIEKLKTKEQGDKVEFIVCKEDGEVICADIQKQANAITKFLKFFRG